MPSVIMLGVVMVSVVALDLLNENVLAVADLANILNFLVGKKISFCGSWLAKVKDSLFTR